MGKWKWFRGRNVFRITSGLWSKHWLGSIRSQQDVTRVIHMRIANPKRIFLKSSKYFFVLLYYICFACKVFWKCFLPDLSSSAILYMRKCILGGISVDDFFSKSCSVSRVSSSLRFCDLENANRKEKHSPDSDTNKCGNWARLQNYVHSKNSKIQNST